MVPQPAADPIEAISSSTIVWARYPSETRAQILSRLVAASSNRYARSSSSFGWGRVNVGAAGVSPL